MRAKIPTALRTFWLALAMLAVSVRVLIPAGFMASQDAQLPYALVICTGQGAISVQAHDHDGHQAPESHHAPCAFAGLGAAPPPPLLTQSVVLVALDPAPVLAWTQSDLRPGRGLAAPPPPATGPPQLTI